MSNLVEIEARQLEHTGKVPFKFKWCGKYYWSRFWVDGGWHILSSSRKKDYIHDDVLIQVNPEEYTKAVVETIKGMIVLPKGFEYRINKDEGGPISVQFFYENTWVDHFLVAVDIAPWLDHYEYILEVE